MAKIAQSTRPAEPIDEKTIEPWLEDGHPNGEFFTKDGEGFEDFQSVLDEKALWGEYIGKLYRSFPKRSPMDKEPRLLKFTSTQTLEAIRKQFGGRKFSVFMSRRVGSRERMIGVFQFDIEAAPIWQDEDNSETVMTGNGTASPPKDMIGLLSKVFQEAMDKKEAAEKQGEKFNPMQALNDAMGMYKTAFTGALDTMSQKTAAGFGFPEFIQLGSLFMPLLMKLFEHKEDPIQKTLLEKAFDRPQPTDFFTQMDAFATGMGKMRELFGVSAAVERAGKNGWADVGMTLAGNLPGILENGAMLLDKAAALRPMPGPATAPAGGPIRVPAVEITPQPRAATVQQIPAATGAAPEPGVTGVVEKPQQIQIPPEAMIEIVRLRVKEVLVDKLRDGSHSEDQSAGVEAAMVADGMDGDFANLIHQILKAAIAGDQDAVAELRKDPVFGPLFNDPVITLPDVMEFAEEYCSYFEPEPPPGDSAPKPIPVPAAVPVAPLAPSEGASA